MLFFHRSNSHNKTKYVQLNPDNCEACWKCIETCTNNVIGKLDIKFHKHSHIDNPENCKGCLKCVKVCEYNAVKAIKQKK